MAALSSEPCELHELRWCGTCAGVDQPAPVRATGATIDASMPGKCAHCGDSFAEGTRISYSTDAGGWVISRHTTSEMSD